jgi:hypothetical protein
MKSLKTQSFCRSFGKYWIIVLLILVCQTDLASQGTKKNAKTRVRMSLAYYNDVSKARSLIATLYYIENRVRIPVTNEMVIFYLGDLSDDIVIDSILTDDKGKARLKFEEDNRFPVNEERIFYISASYKGNKSFTSVKSDMAIKDVIMELFLSEIAGAKTIAVRAFEMGNGSELVPVDDAEVNFYVPRLFSDQLIGEGEISEGNGGIEFPDNIAGDTIGNISIIARIEDHDEYGNVERQLNDFRWGNTQPIEEDKSLMTIEITIPTRALWHTNAPLWMIITLIILLTGVWSHYFYVIYQLTKLKKLSKNKKMNVPEDG